MWRRLVTSSVQGVKVFQRECLTNRKSQSVLPWSQMMRASTWKPKEEISTEDTEDAKAEFLVGYDEIDELVNADRNVQTIFDVSHAPKRKVLQIEMARLVDKYKHCEGDTGAIEVQVAALSHRIKNLSEHLRVNRKDFSCKHGLIQLVHRRRKYLLLLKMRRPNAFHDILQDLKLKEPVPFPKIELSKKQKKNR